MDLVVGVALDAARGDESRLVVARGAERRLRHRRVLLGLERRVLDGGLVDHVLARRSPRRGARPRRRGGSLAGLGGGVGVARAASAARGAAGVARAPAAGRLVARRGRRGRRRLGGRLSVRRVRGRARRRAARLARRGGAIRGRLDRRGRLVARRVRARAAAASARRLDAAGAVLVARRFGASRRAARSAARSQVARRAARARSVARRLVARRFRRVFDRRGGPIRGRLDRRRRLVARRGGARRRLLTRRFGPRGLLVARHLVRLRGCVRCLTAAVSRRTDPLVARRGLVFDRRGGKLGLFGPEGLVGLDVRWADGVLEGLRRQRATRAAGSAIGRGASAVLRCAGLVRAFAEHG